MGFCLSDQSQRGHCPKSWIIFHLSWIIFHLSWTIFHLSWIIFHLSWITFHLSWITFHLSWITFHLSWTNLPGAQSVFFSGPRFWFSRSEFRKKVLREPGSKCRKIKVPESVRIDWNRSKDLQNDLDSMFSSHFRRFRQKSPNLLGGALRYPLETEEKPSLQTPLGHT